MLNKGISPFTMLVTIFKAFKHEKSSVGTSSFPGEFMFRNTYSKKCCFYMIFISFLGHCFNVLFTNLWITFLRVARAKSLTF